MTVQLSPDLQAFIQHALTSGRYESESALVGDAIRLLREKMSSLDQLRQDLQKGVDELNRGERLSACEVFDELERRASSNS